MDPRTLTTPVPPQPPPLTRRARTRRQRRLPLGLDHLPAHAHGIAVAGLLLIALLLRLWGIKQGLPYSYNVDEEMHFVPRAVAYFSHDLNPGYFLNPPAYSYLLHVIFELWFGGADAVGRTYAQDPTTVFIVARVVAAGLGTVAVWLTYLAGARLIGRTAALLGAAMLALAFLPVFYSHLALNDVPTLAPVALSLYGVGGVLRRGRTRDYALAGLGIGLAAATKYTGGITVLCLLGAAVADGVGGRTWIAVRGCALALIVGLGVFLIANPYAALHFSAFREGVAQQASVAAGQDPVKLGSVAGGGIVYYLWTFTWGLDWGPSLAALGGAVMLLARRRFGLALVLIPAPIAFVVFMGEQQRFFGRWLMPIFPIAVILAGYAALELVRWIVRVTGLPRSFAAPVLAILLLAQSVVAAVRNDLVLSRPDTRNLTRAWMVAHVPAGAKVVIEPVVPGTWASDLGRSLPWTATGERWQRFATWLTDVDSNLNPLPLGQLRPVVLDQYERTLRPALIDEYARAGFCWLVIGSLQAGRAFENQSAAPEAVRYYGALAARATRVFHITPFGNGAQAVPFSFDWSIDYYPRQYRRPGPEMSVYRLRGGQCGG